MSHYRIDKYCAFNPKNKYYFPGGEKTNDRDLNPQPLELKTLITKALGLSEFIVVEIEMRLNRKSKFRN